MLAENRRYGCCCANGDGAAPGHHLVSPPATWLDHMMCAHRPITTWLLISALLTMSMAGCKEDPAPIDSSRTGKQPTELRGKTRSSVKLIDVARDWGIAFQHETGATGEYRFPEIMAGGVALADLDNNGLLDVYFTNGNKSQSAENDQSDTANQLFLQHEPGSFINATKSSGLGDTGYGMGVAVGDLNNDGLRDIYVSNYGKDTLFVNLGNGKFENVSDSAGIDGTGWSTSVAWLDINQDDWLDLFIVRYVELNELKECSDELGRKDYCSPKAFYPIHDKLLLNTGNNRFTDISESSGIAALAAAGLGVTCADYNDDGLIDIYVANDAYPNHLWINQGDNTFKERALMRGCALNLNGQAEAGMGVLTADLNGDAKLDLFLTHLRFESHTLYSQNSDGIFTDNTGSAGLAAPSLPLTGFGAVALDLEHDGDLDLAIANGAVVRGKVTPATHMPAPWADYAESNTVFVNHGNGRFGAIEPPFSANVSTPMEVSRGMAAGDVDNDGDSDILITNLAGAPRLYLNETPKTGHWLGIRAKLSTKGRTAVGSMLTLQTSGQQHVAVAGHVGSYQSASDDRTIFGLGNAKPQSLEVLWTDGTREHFEINAIDTHIDIVRGSGRKIP
ncbi:MAG: CRTAC1 family protein [Phycisphaerae bacterium]